MKISISEILQRLGWQDRPALSTDAILLAISLPLFLFPTFYPIATIAVLLAWLFRWIADAYFGAPSLSSSFSILILLFATWIIVPILVTADPELTLDKALGLLLGFIFWRAVVTYFQTKASLNLLIFIVLVIGSAFITVGVLAVDWLAKIPAISTVVDVLPQRIISFSAIGSGQGVQPNQLAGTILWITPLWAGTSVWLAQNKQRILSFLSALITFSFIGVLILSQSRGGWLGALAAIGWAIWLVFLNLPKKHPFRLGTWALPLFIFLLFLLTFALLGPNQLINLWIDPPDASLVGNLGTLSFRQEVWAWSLQAISDFPISGTGLGTFRQVVQRLYPIAIPSSYDIAHAHNVFLQVALDVGLPGLVIYSALLVTFFFKGIKLIKLRHEYTWIIIGALSAQFGFHIYGLIDTIALGAKPAILFWLLISLIHTIDKVQPVEILEP